MYYWKICSLKEEIKKGDLKEKDRFLYAFIYIILSTVALEAVSLMPAESSNIWNVIDSISIIIIVTVGTIFAFKANGGSQGIDFLGRYFSVGLVVTIRFLVFFIPVFLMTLAFYALTVTKNPDLDSSAFDTIPLIICSATMYWRICVHIADINKS